MKKTINIEGMSCGHCTARVEKALEALEGVSVLEVSLEAKHVVVETNIKEAVLKETVEDVGYDVISIN